MSSLPAPATEAAALPERLGVPPLQWHDGDLIATSATAAAIATRVSFDVA